MCTMKVFMNLAYTINMLTPVVLFILIISSITAFLLYSFNIYELPINPHLISKAVAQGENTESGSDSSSSENEEENGTEESQLEDEQETPPPSSSSEEQELGESIPDIYVEGNATSGEPQDASTQQLQTSNVSEAAGLPSTSLDANVTTTTVDQIQSKGEGAVGSPLLAPSEEATTSTTAAPDDGLGTVIPYTCTSDPNDPKKVECICRGAKDCLDLERSGRCDGHVDAGEVLGSCIEKRK
jgi:hypothetical protein